MVTTTTTNGDEVGGGGGDIRRDEDQTDNQILSRLNADGNNSNKDGERRQEDLLRQNKNGERNNGNISVDDAVSASSSSISRAAAGTDEETARANLEIVFFKAPPSVLEQSMMLEDEEGQQQRRQMEGEGNPSEDVPGGLVDCFAPLEDLGGLDFDSLCEVVLSFKCRYCTFLCQDKRSLANHLKANHQCAPENNVKTGPLLKIQQGGEHLQLLPSSLHNNPAATLNSTNEMNSATISLTKQDVTVKVEEDEDETIEPATNHPDQIQVGDAASSCPPEDPQPQLQTDDSEVLPLIPVNNDINNVPSDVPQGQNDDQSIEDVFLCAECDIVFSSKELCCKHMHTIHDLKQFNPDFIQAEIISKKKSPEGNNDENNSDEREADEPKLPKKRKTKPPKQFTAEGGAIVPKRYRVTKEIFFACSKCPIKFESVEVMKFHEQCHATPNDLGMDDDSVSSPPKMHKKSGSSGGGGFICPVCEAKASDDDEDSFSCTIKVFPRWGLCAGHLWREHKIDCELYTCSVCKQFKSPLIARVREHEELHSKQAVHTCKTCNKPFKQLKQLRCHEKYHVEKNTRLPPPKESRWYTPKECHICKRILSDAKCLKKHIAAVHNKLKPFCCNVCGHMTARKAELQLHIRQHTGEKPYKCPVCPFVTGDHNSLRKHKLRHSDQRPYACPYCDYRCIQSCAFKKHILAVHPGQEVVFQCQLCSHASVNEAVFTAHQKEHIRSSRTDRQDSSSDSPSDNGRLHSPENRYSSGRTNASFQKPTWLDEDSLGGVDVIDMGGVTIPASPVAEPNNSLSPPMQDQPAASSPPSSTNEKSSSSSFPSALIEESPKTSSASPADHQQVSSGTLSSDNSVSSIPPLESQDLLATELDTSAVSSPNSPSGGSTLLGTFNVPLGTSGPILQLGQTTYILLPPNTPLPFLASATLPTTSSPSIPTAPHSPSICEQLPQNDDEELSQIHDSHCRDSLLSSARGLSPLCNTNSSSSMPIQLLENIQNLDALDLADVMALTTSSNSNISMSNVNGLSSSNTGDESMFERYLGMPGI